jgi:hypothetical protein
MLPGFGMGIVVSDPVKKIVATPATISAIATIISKVRLIIAYGSIAMGRFLM